MRRFAADIEGNGLLDEVTRIHCLAIHDVDTNESWLFGPDQIDEGLRKLEEANEVIMQNGIGYDLPALLKVKGWGPKPTQRVRDTLVMARLAYSDRERNDYKDPRPEVQALGGGHSLEDWGVRLGVPKIAYKGGWDEYSEEMGRYCQGDTRTTAKLYNHLRSLNLPEEAVILEHRFALEAERLSARGFTLDIEATKRLAEAMDCECEKTQSTIHKLIPDRVEEMKSPAYWIVRWPNGSAEAFDTKGEADAVRKAIGVKPKQWRIEKGPCERRFHPFNCNSRPQIRNHLLTKYGWTSPKLTDKGEALLQEGGDFDELAKDYGSVAEDILRGLPYAEAEPLADFLMVKKRLGQIRDGENAWLKLVKPDGKIHHRLIHIGAATQRCAHATPNLGQVPAVSVSKETGQPLTGLAGRYGVECRSCFVASEGFVVVGADLSAIEARMLAHYLAPFDGGSYIRQVLEGDIHQMNVESVRRFAGYRVNRNALKAPFYGWAYGIGDLKQGRGIIELSEEAKEDYQQMVKYYTRKPRAVDRFHYLKGQKVPYRPIEMAMAQVGNKVNTAFAKGIEGYEEMEAKVKEAAERGYLTPLDKRKIPVRNLHSATNTLLQGSAAIINKRWVVETMAQVRREGLEAYALCSNHDELQSEVAPRHAERYTEVCLGNIRKAGEHYQLSIPLAGEAKCGRNWMETH